MPRYIEESELIDGRVSNDPVVIAVKCAKTADVVEKKLYDRLLENSIVIAEALNKYQTADVVERKKGKWYDVGLLSCRCSECGCKSPKEYLFCPNCGADMQMKSQEEV